MQSLKKIVRAVLAGLKKPRNNAELKSPPCRNGYTHTQERWIRNFFLRLASLGERNFSLSKSKSEKSDFFGFWTPKMGSKGVNLGSKISNSKSVDFFSIFQNFFEFFFEKVVFFRLSGLILGQMHRF